MWKRGVSFLCSSSSSATRRRNHGRLLALAGRNASSRATSSMTSNSRTSRNMTRSAIYGIHTNDNNMRWMSDDNTKKGADTPKEEGEEVVKVVDAEEIFTDDDLNDSKQHPLESLKGSKEEYTVEVKINMPDMGDGDDNTIETWYKQPGDIVKFNDVLCDISTPDFTFGMVIEDEEDAIMGEILVKEGETADDYAPICITYHRQEEPTDDGEE